MYHGTVRRQLRQSRRKQIQDQMILMMPAGRCAQTVMKIHVFTDSLPSFPSPFITPCTAGPSTPLRCWAISHARLTQCPRPVANRVCRIGDICGAAPASGALPFTLWQLSWSIPQGMAGTDGFEPSYPGVKFPCLTAWPCPRVAGLSRLSARVLKQ